MRLPVVFTSLGAAGLLLASALTAGSAQAATVTPNTTIVQCPARVVMPARVTITAPTTTITSASAVFGCTISNTNVGFDVSNTRGVVVGFGEYFLRLGPTVYDPPQIPARTLVPGVHTAVGWSGTYPGDVGDPKYYQLVWSDATSLIKFGGMGGSSSGRSGSVVTVNGLFDEYRGAGYVHPVGRTEYLQRYTDGAWRTIAAQPTDAAGRTSLTLRDGTVAQYRWTSVDNPLTFGYSTPSTFR